MLTIATLVPTKLGLSRSLTGISIMAEVVGRGIGGLEFVSGGVAGGRMDRGTPSSQRVETGYETRIVLEAGTT